jgi:predicted helicase
MNIDSIKTVKDFKTLAHFLSEELNWPIDPENVDVDDLTFEYSPEDIGLSEEFATKVKYIKQIRPLNTNQPWSVFWIDFENKKLPLTVLRRILNVFVTKKRGNSRNIATRDMEDIMFVSGHGEDKNRAITFAHFKRLDDVETIREFYWDGHETKFDHISSYLEKLEWPSNTADVDGWRKRWKAAFTGSTREAITTSDQLAKAMANIAKNIRDRVLEVLEVEHGHGPVHSLYDTFRTGLVHDMTETGFADMYAQTITYGLFSARTMDTDGHFELHQVIDLIPSTNPFLKSLFKECLKTGDNKHKIDLDELGVGSLVDLFDNLNRSDGTDAMQRILAEFGRQTFSGQEDPVIHFYEGFLCEYDSIQRVEKGVYYTPDPVVSFIVRSVNEQLKAEFGLEMGLADTTTWSEMVASGRAEYPVDPKTGKTNKEWLDKIKMRAFVQILDPATGTGTFLKHTIEIIHEEVKAKHKRDRIKTDWIEYWNDYVYRSLLPRVYGFELMMASYSVAHMKIGMYLRSLGYKFEKEQRLNIYLTNSLEPYTTNNSANLFFTSVGAESAGANEVKQNRYFSVVIGNPPYSGISKNNDPWISNLIEDYKYIDGVHFNERKHWLNDDYVKFLRYGQHFIEKNGSGVLAFINPHGFLDNPTFRGMRWHLLKTYDKIYAVDLHGNSKKKETAPDGSADVNVFDIMQGVSINIFIKTGKKKPKELGKIFHFDLLGKREMKYDFLSGNSLSSNDFNEIKPENPNYFFVPKNTESLSGYENGFLTSDLFISQSMGITSARDSFVVDFEKKDLESRIRDFCNREIEHNNFQAKYKLNENYQWKVAGQRSIVPDYSEKYIKPISYRPFDTRYIYFQENLVFRMRWEIMNNFNKRNIAFCAVKLGRNADYHNYFLTNNVTDKGISSSLDNANIFPLYLYPNNNGQQTIGQNSERTPNLNTAIVKKIAEKLCLTFTNEKEKTKETFAPIDILDYIYAVLHSPTYREKYKEFLKIDFPRVPYPKDKETFSKLIELGGEIRQIHLLESGVVDNFITQYPILGDNIINKKASYEDGKVWINKTQYFDNIPLVAWEFFIGGYQPAQKWLKDRKGRELSEEDINHYQKIIVALTETDRIMKEIDEIEIEGSESKVKKMYPIPDENSNEYLHIAADPEQ